MRAEPREELKRVLDDRYETVKEEVARRVVRRVRASQERAAARKAATKKVVPAWRQRLNASLEAARQRRSARRANYAAKHQTV